MFVSFAAERTCVGTFETLEQNDFGMALMSAPESTKNVKLVFGSKTNKRLEGKMLLFVALTVVSTGFLSNYKVGYIYWPFPKISHDTNTNLMMITALAST